jgi:tetratricopeptide (TPR) repeat protein
MRIPTLATRLALAPYALWFYVRTFAWPRGLLPLYPRWSLDAPALADFLPWLGLAALAVVAVALRRRLPRVVFLGAGIFLTNVVLVVGVVWFTFLHHSPVSDHLAYLPNLGLALVAVGGASAAARAIGAPRALLVGALALWCAALGLATRRQIPVWHDTETLWNYTLAHNPTCGLCHYNLGVLLDELGNYEAAAEHLEAALRVDPTTESAMNLGTIRFIQGRGEEAATLYRRAIELDPSNDKAHHNLGVLLTRMGKADEAIAEQREAIRLAPTYIPAHRGLGEALLTAGRLDEARAAYVEATRLVPGDPDAERGLARIAVRQEDGATAVAHYEQALRGTNTPVMEARTRRELAEVLADLERPGDAIAQYQAAHALTPDDDDLTVALTIALLGNHRPRDAVALLSQELARRPQATPLAVWLAWVRATTYDDTLRDGAEAVRLAEGVCARTGCRDTEQLDTLAAAYAEAGRFDDAIAAGRKSMAAADPESDFADQVRERLALYEARQPYREPTPSP